MKYNLVIDATGDNVKLHLIVDDVVQSQLVKSNNRDLTFSLATYVQEILSTCQIDGSQLYGIYLVYGPGKFSATRTSAVLVKTFKMYYSHLKLFILDKFNYFSSNNTLVVLKSDANKYFINYFKDNDEEIKPQLVDQITLNELIEKNSHWKIVSDGNENFDITKNLSKFQEVDANFTLEYFKPAC